MNDRFKKWEKPEIKHGVLTKWNWMVQYPENLALGKRVDIGAFCYLNSKHGLKIGNDVQLGSHCSIYTESTIDNKIGNIEIGDGSCIGSHSTIMPGVKIGKNVIVGAHSFINKNIPDNSKAYGIPIKINE